MPKPSKVEAVEEFKARLQSHALAVAAQYQGITVEQVTALRHKLREQHVEFKVYKNTLVMRALDDLKLSGAAKFIEGPTAWAFSNDPVAPSKIFKEFSKDIKTLVLNGGVLEGHIVTREQVQALDLPPREVLLAQVVGTIAMPLRNLVGVLSAVPRNLVNVLDQIRKQKEEAAAA